METFSKLSKSIILFVILSGIFLRLYGLDIQGFWYDEIFSATFAAKDLKGLFDIVLKDVHPPLYYLLLHLWIKLFGSSEAIIRLLSAMAGILSIFAMYFLGKKVFDRHIAISATIFISLSGSAILYSQEARMYSLVLLFSTFSTLLWINLLNKFKSPHQDSNSFILYTLVCLITAYLHYFGAIYIFFQLIYLFYTSLRFKNYRKEIVILGSIVAAGFLPWLSIHYSSISKISQKIDWVDKGNLTSIITLVDFIFDKSLIFLLFMPFLIGIKENLKKLKEYEHYFSFINLVYLFFTPIIIIFIISQFIPVFYPRYFIILLPCFYLIVSILIFSSSIFKGIRGNYYVLFISILALMAFLIIRFAPDSNNLRLEMSYYKPHNQQWREAIKYVMDNNTDKSIIFVDRHPDLYLYYITRFRKNNNPVLLDYFNESLTKKEMGKIKEHFNRLFIFTTFRRLYPEDEIILQKQFKNCHVRLYRDIYVYDCLIDSK